MKKIYIWGTGQQAKTQMEKDIYQNCDILAFVDNYKKEESFYGYPVIFADEIEKQEYDYIIISLEEPNAILEQCDELKIEKDKIIVIYKDNILSEKHKACTYEKDYDELSNVYNFINMQNKK